MGTFVGTISQRSSEANSIARLVEFSNKITEAFLGCGMVKVPDADFPGQAGTFVVDPAGPGQTQITALASTTGQTVIGYNLFKHPTLSIYVRVEYIDLGFATTTSRAAFIRLVVATGLSEGTLQNPSSTLYPHNIFNISSVSLTTLPATYTQLLASCGPDHFWICGKPVLSLVNSNGYATYPYSISSLAFGVFSSDLDGTVVSVILPSPLTTSGSSIFGQSLSSGNYAAARYLVTNGSAWTTTQNAALGFLLDPTVQTFSGGVRIGRASRIVDGVRHRFNFGYINMASAADAALLEVDLVGEISNYRAMHGFGPASPSFQSASASDLSGVIMPWAA